MFSILNLSVFFSTSLLIPHPNFCVLINGKDGGENAQKHLSILSKNVFHQEPPPPGDQRGDSNFYQLLALEFFGVPELWMWFFWNFFKNLKFSLSLSPICNPPKTHAISPIRMACDRRKVSTRIAVQHGRNNCSSFCNFEQKQSGICAGKQFCFYAGHVFGNFSKTF